MTPKSASYNEMKGKMPAKSTSYSRSEGMIAARSASVMLESGSVEKAFVFIGKTARLTPSGRLADWPSMGGWGGIREGQALPLASRIGGLEDWRA